MTNLQRVREQANTHYSEPPRTMRLAKSSIHTAAVAREASSPLKCHLERVFTRL